MDNNAYKEKKKKYTEKYTEKYKTKNMRDVNG